MSWAKKKKQNEKDKVDAQVPSEVVSAPSSQDGLDSADRVPWSRRLNPLKTNKIPPVPEERQPSKEHDANWVSKLTFHWITPLLSVSATNLNPSWPKAYMTLTLVSTSTSC